MKKLYRSTEDAKVLGICKGIADYFDLDATIVRIISLIVMVATGFVPYALGYIIAGFIIPKDIDIY
ncbi:MAG: PspC domain-containing protein [Defluviitaleaceae bacterium]|nr:PspC domain-containing protein [Defluviitaleaceae bacterium]